MIENSAIAKSVLFKGRVAQGLDVIVQKFWHLKDHTWGREGAVKPSSRTLRPQYQYQQHYDMSSISSSVQEHWPPMPDAKRQVWLLMNLKFPNWIQYLNKLFWPSKFCRFPSILYYKIRVEMISLPEKRIFQISLTLASWQIHQFLVDFSAQLFLNGFLYLAAVNHGHR